MEVGPKAGVCNSLPDVDRLGINTTPVLELVRLVRLRPTILHSSSIVLDSSSVGCTVLSLLIDRDVLYVLYSAG